MTNTAPNKHAFWWYKHKLYSSTYQLKAGQSSTNTAGEQIDKILRDSDTYQLRWNEEVREAWEIFSETGSPSETAKEIIKRRSAGKY
jgi:hypothetical protein